MYTLTCVCVFIRDANADAEWEKAAGKAASRRAKRDDPLLILSHGSDVTDDEKTKHFAMKYVSHLVKSIHSAEPFSYQSIVDSRTEVLKRLLIASVRTERSEKVCKES